MRKLSISIMLLSSTLMQGQHVNNDSLHIANHKSQYAIRPLSVVTGQELSSRSSASLIPSLSGKITGLNIRQITGEPGDENSYISIRGNQSLVDNTSLILVDGIETSFNQLDWSEIETVSVLKDAASLAIYGQRAANGVILITTKRGFESGKPQITLNARFGFQKPTCLPEFASMKDYVRLYNEARVNDGFSPFYTQDQIDGFENAVDRYLYPDVNWHDEILSDHSNRGDYTLTFQGGSKKVNYFLMLGYLHNNGLYSGTDPRRDKNSNILFNRYSFRANIDMFFSDRFTASLDLSGRIMDKKQPNIGTDELWGNMNAATTYPVYAPNGMWAGKQGEKGNPKAAVHEGGFRSYHSRELDETLKLRYELDFITKGLNAFGKISFSSWFKTNYDKTRSFPFAEISLAPGSKPGGEAEYIYKEIGMPGDPVISQKSYWEWNRNNLDLGFDYNRTFGKHSFSGLLMYHQNYYRANGVHTPYAEQKIVGKFGYDFQGTYLGEFSAAYSGSDNYRENNKFGFFPSVALGWVVSNEAFLKNKNIISFLKVNASSGILGNNRIGNTGRFGYEQYFTNSSGIILGGENTVGFGNLTENKLSNPNLTWEKESNTNFAIQSQFFNRLNLDVEVFYNYRWDVLVPASGNRPDYIGIELPYVNEGKVKNKGIELSAQFQDKIGNVVYSFGGNFSFAKNKVIDMNEEPRKDDFRRETGYPLGTIFGLKHIGFFQSKEDIESSPRQLFDNNKPGDMKYADLNNDNVVDEQDMIAIGYSGIPEILYSFNAGLNYKGIDFMIMFQGVGKRSAVLAGNMIKPFVGNARITEWAAQSRWTPENGVNSAYPRLSTLDNQNNYKTSSFWIRDASYLRLKNIELGYTIPKNITKKVLIQNCRIFVNADNLFTWDKIDDISVDPESLEINKYPLMKSINLGLSIGF